MNLILNEWGLWQSAAGLSEKTITERRATIEGMIRMTGAAPEAITPRDIIFFLGRQDITTTTKATYHATIRAYTKWCVSVGIRDDNPADKTPVPKRPKSVPRPMSAADMVALFKTPMRAKTRMMITLASAQGLRVHEIAKVRGEDFADGRLMLVGKGGKQSVMPLHARVAELLPAFPSRGYLFPSGGGTEKPVQPAAVRAAIYRAMGRAGVEGHPHRLRHWYGTNLLSSGVDLRVVQELMRHESVATTQIYTLVSDDRQRAGQDQLVLPAA